MPTTVGINTAAREYDFYGGNGIKYRFVRWTNPVEDYLPLTADYPQITADKPA